MLADFRRDVHCDNDTAAECRDCHVADSTPVMGSPDQKASKHGFGREGVKGKQPSRLTRIEKGGQKIVESDGKKKTEQTGGEAKSDKQGSDKPGGGKPEGDQRGGGSGNDGKQGEEKSKTAADGDKSGAPKSNGASGDKAKDGQTDSSKPGDGKPNDQSQPKAGDKAPSPADLHKIDQQSSQKSPQGQPSPGKGGDDAAKKTTERDKPESGEKPTNDEKAKSGDQPEQSSDSNDQQSDDNQQDETPPPAASDPMQFLNSILPFIQYLFYAAVLGFGLYYAWRHRTKLLAALQHLLAGLSDFWNSLFGRKPTKAKASEKGTETLPPRPFTAFDDPFASGKAAHLSAEQLVRYSFAALEAWARENTCERPPDQTPHEFARNIGSRYASLRQPTVHLANLYCEAAYAPGRLRLSTTQPLEELWQILRGAGQELGAGRTAKQRA